MDSNPPPRPQHTQDYSGVTFTKLCYLFYLLCFIYHILGCQICPKMDTKLDKLGYFGRYIFSIYLLEGGILKVHDLHILFGANLSKLQFKFDVVGSKENIP